jgi:hypothetical protein
MNKEVKVEDILRVIFDEGLAILNKKYDVHSYKIFFDKKTHWELQKPRFYFDMYPESKVDSTLWVMDLFYFKIRRNR